LKTSLFYLLTQFIVLGDVANIHICKCCIPCSPS